MSSHTDSDSLESCLYLAGFGATMAFAGYHRIKKKTMIKNIAKQVISAASAGVVELEGVAWPMKMIETSIKGEKIVFHYLKIEKLVKSGKSTKWITVWEKRSLEHFLLFDHSGMVVINPESNAFELMIEDLSCEKYNPHKLTKTQLESFNRLYDGSVDGLRPALGKSVLGQLFSSEFKLTEHSIPIGSPLLIHGHLNPSDVSHYISLSPDLALFRERTSKLLKNKSFMKNIFDKNKDGEVDLKELRTGFISTLKGSQKISPGNFSVVNLKSEGHPTEKIYGMVSSHSGQELCFADCFEEQLLKAKPVYLDWFLFISGLAMIGAAIYLFWILIKV